MKSDCGLKANSRATKCCISSEELRLREARAYGVIGFKQFEKKYKQLKKAGKIWRK